MEDGRRESIGGSRGGHWAMPPKALKVPSAPLPPNEKFLTIKNIYLFLFFILADFQNKVAEIRGENRIWGKVRLGAQPVAPPQTAHVGKGAKAI